MAKKIETKTFTRKLYLRHHTAIAVVNKKTGMLIGIKGGCTCWESFNDARAHYNGSRPGHWSNDHRCHLLGMAKDDTTYNFYLRSEARCLLRLLESDVLEYQRKLKNKAAKARKLARAAKRK